MFDSVFPLTADLYRCILVNIGGSSTGVKPILRQDHDVCINTIEPKLGTPGLELNWHPVVKSHLRFRYATRV
jgi:hypothetical protein